MASELSRKVKWGVIGSGGIARRRTIPEGIVPAKNAELAIVYDVNAKANAEVAGQFGVQAAASLGEGTIGQGGRGRMVAHLEAGVSGYDAQPSRVGDGGRMTDPAPVNMHRAEIEEFSQALIEGRPPSNSARIGLQNQEVLAIRYLALKAGWAGVFSVKPVYDARTFKWSAIATATSLAALTYIGFDGVTTLAEEVKNPKRNVPMATVLFSVVEVYLAQMAWPDYSTFTHPETAFMGVNLAAIREYAFRRPGGRKPQVLLDVFAPGSILVRCKPQGAGQKSASIRSKVVSGSQALGAKLNP